jgi:hypothetical protein
MYNSLMVKKETVSEVMRAMAKKKWAKLNKKEKSEAGRKAVAARWAAYRKAKKEKEKSDESE